MEIYFKQIEQKRQQLGMTIETLCKKANVLKKSYYDYKSCKSIPATDKFIRLNKAVNIKTIEL